MSSRADASSPITAPSSVHHSRKLPNEIIAQIALLACSYLLEEDLLWEYRQRWDRLEACQICTAFMLQCKWLYQLLLPIRWKSIAFDDPLPGSAYTRCRSNQPQTSLHCRLSKTNLASRRLDLALSRSPLSLTTPALPAFGCFVTTLNLSACKDLEMAGIVRTLKVVPHLETLIISNFMNIESLPSDHPLFDMWRFRTLKWFVIDSGIDIDNDVPIENVFHLLELFGSVEKLHFACALAPSYYTFDGDALRLFRKTVRNWANLSNLKSLIIDDGWSGEIDELFESLAICAPGLEELTYWESEIYFCPEVDGALLPLYCHQIAIALIKLKNLKVLSLVTAWPIHVECGGLFNPILQELPNLQILHTRCDLIDQDVFDEYPVSSLQTFIIAISPAVESYRNVNQFWPSDQPVGVLRIQDIRSFWDAAREEASQGRKWLSRFRMGMLKYLWGGPFLIATYERMVDIAQGKRRPVAEGNDLHKDCHFAEDQFSEIEDNLVQM